MAEKEKTAGGLISEGFNRNTGTSWYDQALKRVKEKFSAPEKKVKAMPSPAPSPAPKKSTPKY
jgi:hypothetical protein